MNDAVVLKQLIQRRKSSFPKEYSGADVPQSVLDEIVSAADFAPNHKRTKPWRFKVFTGEEKKLLAQTMANLYKEFTPPELFLEKKYADISDKIDKSAAVITIVVNFSRLVPQWEEIAATAMAVQNMYLTCTANNAGCYWSTPDIKDHMNSFLSLDENQACFGVFYLGML